LCIFVEFLEALAVKDRLYPLMFAPARARNAANFLVGRAPSPQADALLGLGTD
jgi:hypothetical protein